MRDPRIIKLEDGKYNLYDFSEFGHMFRATKEDLHTLVFEVTELLRKDPVVRVKEGPEDHELAD